MCGVHSEKWASPQHAWDISLDKLLQSRNDNWAKSSFEHNNAIYRYTYTISLAIPLLILLQKTKKLLMKLSTGNLVIIQKRL